MRGHGGGLRALERKALLGPAIRHGRASLSGALTRNNQQPTTTRLETRTKDFVGAASVWVAKTHTRNESDQGGSLHLRMGRHPRGELPHEAAPHRATPLSPERPRAKHADGEAGRKAGGGQQRC